jgi:hydroxyethylthiazole kinase-like uncharacterized protein yjeF
MAITLVDIFPAENVASLQQFFESAASECIIVNKQWVTDRIRSRRSDAHKGDFGHLLLIAGSDGKTGAATLSAHSAMRTGCGLLTAAIPATAQTALLTVLPEAMTLVRNNDVLPGLDRFTAVGVGPGMGLDTGTILLALLEQKQKPLVIDADGITVLSQHRDWYEQLSASVILTPHAGEFDRLTQSHDSFFTRCQTQLAFSRRYSVHVLLKGKNTSITTPDGQIYFNTTGNSGMATAGSGDVLTGIIASLLAQGYDTTIAAVLGAYLHGYAGDVMAEKLSKTSLLASDLIDGIPAFFLEFEKQV